MSPMKKSLGALAAAAMFATVGYATAQSTDAPVPDTTGTQAIADTAVTGQDASAAAAGTTTTTTVTDVTTQVLPAQPTGIVDLQKPKGTVTSVDKQADNAQGMENSVMTTGVSNGATRPSIGDHATPPIAPEPTVLAVTTERTTTTTTTPAAMPAPVAAPAPAPAPEPAAEPMPAPRADRN